MIKSTIKVEYHEEDFLIFLSNVLCEKPYIAQSNHSFMKGHVKNSIKLRILRFGTNITTEIILGNNELFEICKDIFSTLNCDAFFTCKLLNTLEERNNVENI